MKKKRCLVSGCLAGVNCRYDGCNKMRSDIARLVEEGVAIAVCPEFLGGLAIPRPPADLDCGVGIDVLNGKARVVNADGRDVTEHFLQGARETLTLARREGVGLAILKENSPSCGCLQTYVRNRKGSCERSSLVPGPGVTAALLLREGVRVISDQEWDRLSEFDRSRLLNV